MNLKEETLHAIWRYQAVHPLRLRTVDGQKIEVIWPGNYNALDSGPDFFNSKVYIDDSIWAGNVEIHVKSSDWIKHLHHFDPAYKNVILHVVWEDDLGKIDGLRYIPTVELKSVISEKIISKYASIDVKNNTVVCKNNLAEIKRIDWIYWKEKLLIERFESKAKQVEKLFELHKSWEEVAFRLILLSLGAKVNKHPMGMLPNYISSKILMKERHRPNMIEALLLGCSGMLDFNLKDHHLRLLQELYDFSSSKYSLKSMDHSWWKFARLRPGNFPNLQLSILSSNIKRWNGFSSVLLNSKNLNELKTYFSEQANDFWDDRYKLDSLSKKNIPKRFGKQQLQRIFINAVLPFQIAHKRFNNVTLEYDEVLDQLTKFAPEKNRVTNIWEELLIENKSLWDSQALLELYYNYCNRKKCLNCSIGIKTIKSE